MSKKCYLFINYPKIYIATCQHASNTFYCDTLSWIESDAQSVIHQLKRLTSHAVSTLILPQGWIHLLITKKPDIPSQFLLEALHWELVDKISTNWEDLIVEYAQSVEKSHEILVAMLAKKHYSEVQKQLAELKLKVDAIIPWELAFLDILTLADLDRGLILLIGSSNGHLFTIKNHVLSQITLLPGLDALNFKDQLQLILKNNTRQKGNQYFGYTVFYACSKTLSLAPILDPIWGGGTKNPLKIEPITTLLQPLAPDNITEVPWPWDAVLAATINKKNPLQKTSINFSKKKSRIPSLLLLMDKGPKFIFYLLVILLSCLVLYQAWQLKENLQIIKKLETKVNKHPSTNLHWQKDILGIIPKKLRPNLLDFYSRLNLLSEKITPNVWVDSIFIDQTKNKLEIKGGGLSTKPIVTFFQKLQKEMPYKKSTLDFLEKTPKPNNKKNDQRNKILKKEKPYYLNYIIHNKTPKTIKSPRKK